MANELVVRTQLEVKDNLTVSGSLQTTGAVNNITIDTSGSLNQQISGTALALAIAL